MPIAADVESDIQTILTQPWNRREGVQVPSTERVLLSGGGVGLDATVLYADLADSTELAIWDRRVTARLCRAFLAGASRLIRATKGVVRSFDGDRVMGVYVGARKNDAAAQCALHINWMFLKVLRPKFEARYAALRNGSFMLAHCTGVDASQVLAVRAGIRNSNDLIWVGRAPNVAAKLSAIRNAPNHSFISDDVHRTLSRASRYSADDQCMWEGRDWPSGPIAHCYASSFWWKP